MAQGGDVQSVTKERAVAALRLADGALAVMQIALVVRADECWVREPQAQSVSHPWRALTGRQRFNSNSRANDIKTRNSLNPPLSVQPMLVAIVGFPLSSGAYHTPCPKLPGIQAQHFLYFLPLPQGQGAFLRILP